MPGDRNNELLYDPHDEHDACGVGFVADVSGRCSHGIIENALEALSNLTHRGAIDADGRTGDGAGLLTQLPLRFFQRQAKLLGQCADGDLAVGVFFFPRNRNNSESCRQIVTQVCEAHDLAPVAWRQVPVNERELGSKALATVPRIEQLLVTGGRVSKDELEAAVYRARCEIEQRTSTFEDFYIPSFSSRTIVYKGLFVGSQLARVYPDLLEPDFEAALAVFHQRYSTNTFPNWSLAQPFRLLAHNGEINTISGNRSWMRARAEAGYGSQGSGERRTVIWSRGSDSASLDNALEWLVMSGRDLAQGVMMLIPEAYESSDEVSAELRGFYDYAAGLTEPWDGPAAVAFSDGRFVGAALDRNGLRPSRYALTTEGRVIVSSEAGVLNLPAEAVLQKGRLGPGQMIAVDTELGVLLKNDEIKRQVANRNPYAGWARRSSVHCPKINADRSGSTAGEHSLIVRMKRFGYTAEDVERILGPMLVEGKEPIGSMGDDTPLALLSTKPRLLYSYFKQRFAQVTNPAIDPIRERMVMSLTTLLGPRADLVSENAPHTKLIKLSSPILSEAELQWIRRQSGGGLRCLTLNAAFETESGPDSLTLAVEDLCKRASEAIDDGYSVLIVSDLVSDENQAPIPMLLAIGALHNHLIRTGQRLRASLVAHTGEPRDDHQIACLIAFGASAVCPSLAFEVIAHEGPKRGLTVTDALSNYKRGLGDGLRQGRLAHPGRADQAENGSLHVVLELADRQVLEDSLLDLL